MPLYDFHCNTCGCDFEDFATPNTVASVCPFCQQGVAVKKFPAPNFRVKGFNAKNGYNLPNYDDLLDENGYSK